VEGTCVRVLARLGQWLALRWQDAGAVGAGGVETNMPGEALRGLATLDPDGFCRVRLDALVFLLDAVHSMLALHRLLERAQARDNAEAAARVVVSNHHLEASSETFFTHSMTADCVVGTVIQYTHKFSYLFHSISQAIYYNRPNYMRQRQLPLACLLEPTTEKTSSSSAPAGHSGPGSVNLLPLLLELAPDIPVLFEHTGAGHRGTHARHEWAWVMWVDFVLLVDADMNAWAALDARALAALLDDVEAAEAVLQHAAEAPARTWEGAAATRQSAAARGRGPQTRSAAAPDAWAQAWAAAVQRRRQRASAQPPAPAASPDHPRSCAASPSAVASLGPPGRHSIGSGRQHPVRRTGAVAPRRRCAPGSTCSCRAPSPLPTGHIPNAGRCRTTAPARPSTSPA
jgi:hypothetical protein